MKVEIDFNDYLSNEGIKEIIADEVRCCVREKFRTYQAAESFLKNVGYNAFLSAISNVMNLNTDEIYNIITQKLSELLNDDNSYKLSLFRRKGMYSATEDGIDTKILDDVLSKSRPIIERKVEELIENYPFREVKEDICLTIYDCIERRLFKSKDMEAQS